jgi:hypothetical protein
LDRRVVSTACLWIAAKSGSSSSRLIEDQHECALLSQRISAFLVSQSFLVVASGAVYSNLYGKTWSTPIVTLIAGFAIVLAVVALTAIRIGCSALRRWHAFGNALLTEDSAAKDCFLKGFHLGRVQADKAHFWSMDVFNTAIPIAFLTGWIGVIAILHPSPRWLIPLGLLWVVVVCVNIWWLPRVVVIGKEGNFEASDFEITPHNNAGIPL